MKIASIHINYNEPDQDSYKSIYIYLSDIDINKTIKKTFSSKNPIKDFSKALSWLATNKYYDCIYSSSVDNFIMDGSKYTIDEGGWLKEITTTYKIVEMYNGKIKTLYHGTTGSRILPLNKWIKADIKQVRDGSGNRYYKSGFHSITSLVSATEYLKRFNSKKRKLRLVECTIKNSWNKSHSRDNILLSEYIKINKII